MCPSLLPSLILFILTGFWAQKVEVLSPVTGYVGLDVTLPCRFIQGKESSNVTQSQWDFLSPDGNKTLIMVFNKQHGKGVHESHLKGRVDIDDQSLQINNVELSDAGSYICTINTFPLGSFHDTTQLHVQDDFVQQAVVVSENSSGCSAGCIAGMVVGCLVVVAAASAGGYSVYNKR
uniref:Ig-like domain-containing protein n=1 Tax=Oryzias latipes TaxID=8090 RepID=A0A3P9K0E2_ORYLA